MTDRRWLLGRGLRSRDRVLIRRALYGEMRLGHGGGMPFVREE